MTEYYNPPFFIPQVSVYTKKNTIDRVQQISNWIAFNYFELLHSKYYGHAKQKGIHQTFGISPGKHIFLTTADHDERLLHFYNNAGVQMFKKDVLLLGADLIMGLDWFAYQDDTLSERKKSIERGIELTKNCLDVPNLIPTIQGTNFKEVTDFIQVFKKHGNTRFVLPIRGQMLNFGCRKKSQNTAALLTSTVVRQENIKLFVTGCNSPGLMQRMPSVYGFIGQGYLIQAKQRRLIMGKRYFPIMHPVFSLCCNSCCFGLSKSEICKNEFESNRVVHNLIQIRNSLINIEPVYQSFIEVPICG
jgi:hypothetical protein